MQIEMWDFIKTIGGMMVALIGAIWTFGVVLAGQFEKRLADKFATQDAARALTDAALNETLQRHLSEERQMGEQIAQLERDFLNWKGELPLNYVRREDYVRGQTVIEAKLDALYSEIKLVQLKGLKHDA